MYDYNKKSTSEDQRNRKEYKNSIISTFFLILMQISTPAKLVLLNNQLYGADRNHVYMLSPQGHGLLEALSLPNVHRFCVCTKSFV